MLQRLTARGFKSLGHLTIDLARLTVLFGPNAAGKSNVVDALQVLSRIATERTLEDALAPPVRGYASEMFALPQGGLDELLGQNVASFELGADVERQASDKTERFRYRIGVELTPRTGALVNGDEELSRLTVARTPTGNPRIERVGARFTVRANRQGHPRYIDAPINHALLSDPTLTGRYFRDIELVRTELRSWRSYYLDPSSAMRSAAPPSEVADIGPRGEHLAAFLYRLQQEYPDRFSAVTRAVRSVIPSVRGVEVELDRRRGTIDLLVEQEGVRFSSRIVSEGTLRILGLACIAATPFPAGLVAFEEPENGVHPRRIEIVARFLTSAASNSQVVVTTHSPAFLSEILQISREQQNGGNAGIAVFACSLENGATSIRRFPDPGPLLSDRDMKKAFTEHSEEAVIEAMYVRGWLDG